MRSFIGLVVTAVSLVAAAPEKPALKQVHSVYLLPMSNGLDQYIANRLTDTGLFQVVTDPQKADAIFTDQIGPGFEQKLTELYPPPKAEGESKEDKSDEGQIDKAMEKPNQRIAATSRGRGTLFLVDRSTRSVVWSIYHPVKSSRPDDTNRRAESITKKLAKDVQGPAPSK